MRTPSIHAQLAWVLTQLEFQRTTSAASVARGTMTQERADEIITTGEAVLRTMDALRHVVVGKEYTHG